MTGPEHYRKAEELLDGIDMIEDSHDENATLTGLVIAEAQVHAALALAAATAITPGGIAGLVPMAELQAWVSVAGEPDEAPALENTDPEESPS